MGNARQHSEVLKIQSWNSPPDDHEPAWRLNAGNDSQEGSRKQCTGEQIVNRSKGGMRMWKDEVGSESTQLLEQGGKLRNAGWIPNWQEPRLARSKEAANI